MHPGEPMLFSLRTNTVIRVLVTAALALAFGVARADPVTYTFTFTDPNTGLLDGRGTFTTDGPGADPGFFLVTGVTFTTLRVDGAIQTGLVSSLEMNPGASYDPTSGRFVNHFGGQDFPDIGDTDLDGHLGPFSFTLMILFGESFESAMSLNSFEGFLLESDGEDIAYQYQDNLTVVAADAALPEPEPAALLLVGGVGVMAASSRRRTRTASSDIDRAAGHRRRFLSGARRRIAAILR
jgi:hypothetical protein